jgi:uncharacterized membrane protein YeiB
VPAEARLAGVDVARGVALLGMMAVHVFSAGPGAGGAVHALAGGRSAALFAVLAGVGLSLVSGGSDPSPERLARARASIPRRCLVIAVVGLTLGLASTPVAIILVYYAVLFLVAVPALGASPGRLAAAALGWALLSPVLSQGLRLWWSPGGPGSNLSWLDLTSPGPALEHLLLTGYYPVLTWTTYLLAGLAVGRLPLTDPRTAQGLTLLGAALALGAWLSSVAVVALAGGERALDATLPAGSLLAGRGDGLLEDSFFGTTPTASWWFVGVMAPHSGAVPDLVHTTGTALLVIGLALLLVPRATARRRRWVTGPLAAAGSMTLTLYCLHVLAMGLVDAAGLDPRVWAWPVLEVNVVVALLLATWWGAPARRGPLEDVVAAVAGSARR